MSVKHDHLIVSAAPHVNAPQDTASIMRDVCIALVPALIWAIYIFGFRALLLTVVCVAASVFFEWLVRKIMGRDPMTILDWSAAVTGMILAFNLPVSYLATVAVLSLCFGRNPLFDLCAGGVMLGAFFMATDYVTSPITNKGKIIFGIGCGLFTMLIRQFGAYPEGASFAILLMNILTPHIDNWTRHKIHGAEEGGKK